MATTQVGALTMPIIIMEEPETALYPAAIGQIMAYLERSDSPQLIVSSHSESVVRRFGFGDIFRIGKNRKVRRLDEVINNEKVRWAAEKLTMPGSTSALFAERVLVVEGGGDAFTFRVLDKLAGVVTKGGKEQESLASLGWTVFSANRADNIPETVLALKNLGIEKVATLFDGDTPGRASAEKTKDKCPTFVYKSLNEDEPTLELALMCGLASERQDRAIKKFRDIVECTDCSVWKDDVRNCLRRNECPAESGPAKLKAKFNRRCLEQYGETRTFPPAFEALLVKIDDAEAGEIIELPIEDCK